MEKAFQIIIRIIPATVTAAGGSTVPVFRLKAIGTAKKAFAGSIPSRITPQFPVSFTAA
jgi:hypothetical protein